MGNNQFLQLLCFFSCIALSIHTHAISKKTITISSAIIASLGGLYGMYTWYGAEYTNAELCDQAQKLYDALYEKHGSITFLYRTGLETTSEAQLKALIGHKDIGRLEAVTQDLPQLQEIIGLLKKRIKSDEKAHLPEDEDLIKWHDELENFRKKLHNAALFWKKHAPYFALHKTLDRLRLKYKDICSSYELPQEPALLGSLYEQLAKDLQLLEKKAKQCKKYDHAWSDTVQLISELNLLSAMILKEQQAKNDQKSATREQATQTGE